MPLSVMIVGRPNVGKSTLFNRILGKRRAVVHDSEGVTRDWQMYPVKWGHLDLQLYDTPGTQTKLPSDLSAECIIWVVAEHITGVDWQIAQALRKQDCPVIMVANKCEALHKAQQALAEYSALGFGPLIPISALHGKGLEALQEALGCAHAKREQKSSEHSESEPTDKPVCVTIMGRPNAGKSSLTNAFLGYHRMKIDANAGTTIDAVATERIWHKRLIRIIDTAGIKKNDAAKESLQILAEQEAYRALDFSHVIVLVVDATQGIVKQDAALAEKIMQEGRALIIALNKWDLVQDPKECLRRIGAQWRSIPVMPISCMNHEGLAKLWLRVILLYDQWNDRIATGPLNRWLKEQISRHAPPRLSRHPIKIKYITQIKVRPPTFVLFGHGVKKLSLSYQRYLTHSLCSTFALASPRLILQEPHNPYVPEPHPALEG